jgi:hypothetical protein
MAGGSWLIKAWPQLANVPSGGLRRIASAGLMAAAGQPGGLSGAVASCQQLAS